MRAAPFASRRGTTDRHDIDTPDDVDDLVREFYGAVAQDSLLGPMFNDVAQVDWSAHLPKLTAFWCRFLFAMPGYQGNPYAMHKEVHHKSPFTVAHFERWLELFDETLEDGWEGPNVERMKGLARKVAQVHGQQLVGRHVSFVERWPDAT